MTWLKITFDPLFDGMARVTNYPRKRPAFRLVKGSWVVFDRDVGYMAGTAIPLPSSVRFRSNDVADCDRFIEATRRPA